MKPLFQIIILAVVLLHCTQQELVGQEKDNTPKFVNEFLNIGVGARAHGMFGSVVASVDDVTAGFWNPAGLTEIDAPFQASAMHAEWFGGIANYDYIAFGKKLGTTEKKSFGSISFIRMGVDNIPNTLSLIGPDGTVNYDNLTEFSVADYALLASYARELRSNLSVGGSVKIIRRAYGFGSAWGFGADLGAKYRMGNFTLGLMAKDVTSTFNAWKFNFSESDKDVFLQTGNIIPISSTEITLPRLIIGANYHSKSDNVSWMVEANLNLSTNGQKAGVFSGKSVSLDPTVGVEVGLSNKVFVRAGIGNIQKIVNEVNTQNTDLSLQPNVGLGLNLGRINIDYALTNIGDATDVLVSHIFSVKLDFISNRKVSTAPTQGKDVEIID